MKLEKKIKKRIESNLNKFVVNPYEKRRLTFPIWAKISLPIGGLALATAVSLMVFAPRIEEGKLNALVRPEAVKLVEKIDTGMSKKTYDSYKSFSKKFSSLMIEVNNSVKESSVSVSIPDAYIGFAISGIISDSLGLADVLSYLELDSLDEMRTAVKEVLSGVCTISKDKFGLLYGGLNYNSIWLNPENVAPLEKKDAELYKDLKTVFNASIYLEKLTNETANRFAKERTPKEIPAPDLELPEFEEQAFATLSGYTAIDHFRPLERGRFLSAYESGASKKPYIYNGSTKRVDCLTQSEHTGHVYEGDGFVGAPIYFENSSMEVFLPDDYGTMPSVILDDVLSENYSLKEEINDINQTPSDRFILNITAPYFTIDNKLEIKVTEVRSILPNLSQSGSGSRLVRSLDEADIYLSSIAQASRVNFDYNGFVSASMTAFDSKPCSGEYLPHFTMDVDHPFAFVYNRWVNVDDRMSYLPIVVGEVVDPAYQG